LADQAKSSADGVKQQGSDAIGGAAKKAGGVADSAGSLGQKAKEATENLSDKISDQAQELPSKDSDTVKNLAPADIVGEPEGVFADDGLGKPTSGALDKAKGASDGAKDSVAGVANEAEGKSDGLKDGAGGLTDTVKGQATDQLQNPGKETTGAINGVNIDTGALMKAISPSGGGEINGKGIEINVQTTKEGMSLTIKIPAFQ